ncbi:MAG: TetR/AcrR family transcriptional regulator [Cyanobacteriota bacterium]
MSKLSTRQQEIINVSIKLIAEKGIQNLTTKKLSERIGISEPALYRHFKSKQDILLSVLDDFEERFDIITSKINDKDLSNIEKLKKFYLLRCEEFAKTPEVAKVIFSEEIFQNEKILSEKVASIMKKHQKTISEIIDKAQNNNEIRSDIPIEHITLIIMGSLRLLVTRWRISGFSFDIVKESKNVWKSINTLISKEV